MLGAEPTAIVQVISRANDNVDVSVSVIIGVHDQNVHTQLS